MALRPEFHGFSLEQFNASIGSGNAERAEELVVAFDGLVTMDDPAQQDVGRNFIRAVVMGDTAPGGIDGAETEAHVMAMISLAKSVHVISTDSNFWKSSFLDYFRDVSDALRAIDPELSNILARFGSGRSMWGKYIDTSWSFYAWASRAEVQRMRRGFDDHPKLLQGETEFGRDFQRWLREIDEAGADLWFYCY